jgi:hypothetical protein
MALACGVVTINQTMNQSNNHADTMKINSSVLTKRQSCVGKHRVAHFSHIAMRGLNEIIGATLAIEGSAYWIALVVSWMQTLGSQPLCPKFPRSLGLEACLNPKESTYGGFAIQFGTTIIPFYA